MKKNNKGFFLAETIVVLALVTTVVVFVSANVPNLYKNYKLQIESYDRTEDIYLLKAIYEANKSDIDGLTDVACPGAADDSHAGQKIYNSVTTGDISNGSHATKLIPPTITLSLPTDYSSSSFYLTGYLTSLKDDSNYNFNKYLKRIKKTSNFKTDYRLIGVLKKSGSTETTYASIRIENPDTLGNRGCNLGD